MDRGWVALAMVGLVSLGVVVAGQVTEFLEDPRVACEYRDTDPYDNVSWEWRNGSCERVEVEALETLFQGEVGRVIGWGVFAVLLVLGLVGLWRSRGG